MRIFGIDPGSDRTGYGCVETDGLRHSIVMSGAISAPALAPFPEGEVTATESVVAACALIRAADLNMFDVAMWFHRAPGD